MNRRMARLLAPAALVVAFAVQPALADDGSGQGSSENGSSDEYAACVALGAPIHAGICVPERMLYPSTYVDQLPLP